MRRYWILFVMLGAASAMAQIPTQGKPDKITSSKGLKYGTLFMQTNIGSFRIVGAQGFDQKVRQRAEGRIEMTFTGTVLINDPKCKIIPSGNLRKEYDAKDRIAYFGSGKIVIEGEFWAVQFFGTKLDARWTGWGSAQMFGEFDRNLSTGNYWFDNAPKKQFWSPFGTTIALPYKPLTTDNTAPKERKPGGGK